MSFFDPTCRLGAIIHFFKSLGFEGTGTDLYTIPGDHRDYNDPNIKLPEHDVVLANFPFIHLNAMCRRIMNNRDKNGIKIPSFLLVPTAFITNVGA
jgi:hypothetical protein